MCFLALASSSFIEPKWGRPNKDKGPDNRCFTELLLNVSALNDLPFYFYLPRRNTKASNGELPRELVRLLGQVSKASSWADSEVTEKRVLHFTLKLISPAHPSLRKQVSGTSHSTLIFLPQFSSSSPLSQSFSPSHLQDTGRHWVKWAPQLNEFMRHVLISVDDIQSQKSLQTHQCKVAAPVLLGRGDTCNSVAWHTGEIWLTSSSLGGCFASSTARSHAHLCHLAASPRALAMLLLQASMASPVLAFVLLGIVRFIGRPAPWPLFICWIASGTPR